MIAALPTALAARTAVLLMAVLPLSALPQGSRADYDRAAALSSRTAGLVRNESISPRWLDGGKKLWYVRENDEGGREYVVIDGTTGTRIPLLGEDAVIARVREAIGENEDPGRFTGPLAAFDGRHFYVFFAGGAGTWRCEPGSDAVEAVRVEEAVPLHLRPRRRVGRSRSGGDDTHAVFVNGLEVPLKLAWIDLSGKRREYGAVEPGQSHRQHTFAGHAWVLVDEEGEDRAAFVAGGNGVVAWIGPETPRPGARREIRGRRRPVDEGETADERKAPLFVRDHDVWLRDPETGEELALTTGGTAEDGYAGAPRLSPDGSKAIVTRRVAGEEREVYYVEAAPRDQLQPKLHSYGYRKPGDRIPISKPHLFDLAAKREIPVEDDLFENPWSITDLRWSPDGSRFTFLFNQRGHQVLRVVAVDAESGEARAIVEEKSDTFVDYSQKQFVRYLDETSEILWSSERDGWNHLYLYDAKTGEVKHQVTSGEWVVRGVEKVDEKTRQVWFRAGGIQPGQDPYHVHHARVNFDGTGLVVLTEGDGTHDVSFSPDGELLVDRWSRVDHPPVTELRRASDGSLLCELERADWSALLATGWRPPERFVAKGRDGVTDIWGILRRPTNHDPARSYPVIEYIYAGPHGAFVPKAYRRHSAQSELAELGFIVVQIDGMGTNHRSKAFHDVAWRNLGDSGLPDRIRWIRAAAAMDPSMDLSRVGIYGGSAGGQSALRAMLAHGDFYHAAVADCGCHDNRMDKIWWNEAWMGWPVGPHYEEQSNVTQAHRLQGELMLVVGAMDENVDPASTMQVVDALIRADLDFELLVFPSSGHGAAESAYGKRRRRDFFVRHLLGVEPRWE